MKRYAFLVAVTLTMFFCLSGSGLAIGFIWGEETMVSRQGKEFFMQDKQPDATLALSQGQVGLGIGYSWGDGTLSFRGNKYSVSVQGLSLLDVGITKATAVGKVYGLKKLEDFNGNYVAATAEGTIGGGAGATTMKNQNGVVIDLFTTTQGLNLKLAPSGISLKIKQ